MNGIKNKGLEMEDLELSRGNVKLKILLLLLLNRLAELKVDRGRRL